MTEAGKKSVLPDLKSIRHPETFQSVIWWPTSSCSPDFERADRIGESWGNPKTRTFAELLIDCEEDRTFRAVLVGMLLEADRSGPSS
jgi:hypothetical protein